MHILYTVYSGGMFTFQNKCSAAGNPLSDPSTHHLKIPNLPQN